MCLRSGARPNCCFTPTRAPIMGRLVHIWRSYLAGLRSSRVRSASPRTEVTRIPSTRLGGDLSSELLLTAQCHNCTNAFTPSQTSSLRASPETSKLLDSDHFHFSLSVVLRTKMSFTFFFFFFTRPCKGHSPLSSPFPPPPLVRRSATRTAEICPEAAGGGTTETRGTFPSVKLTLTRI